MVVLLSLASAASAQASPDVPTLLARAVTYVAQFHQRFGSAVAEERYEQWMPPTRGLGANGGTLASHVTLRSDFLLVKVGPTIWMPFRDVFERDGKPVRDRQDRLMKLFVDGASAGAVAQAQQIMNESSRYNIGNGTRTINIPTLPLMFLAPDVMPGLSFAEAKPDSAAAGRVVSFTEVARPTLIHTTGNRDLPAKGRFWIDEATGIITRADVVVEDTQVASEIIVTFQPDETLGIWVPARMDERFRRQRDPIEARGVATYTNFRRFQVSTSESLDDKTGSGSAKP